MHYQLNKEDRGRAYEGQSNGRVVYYNLPPEKLILQSIESGQGVLSDTGALVVNTGEFTGRSPRDKFIVCDKEREGAIHWNEFNIPIEEKYFDTLYVKMKDYLQGREIWIRDCTACADERFALTVRITTDTAWASLFCYNMFLRASGTGTNGTGANGMGANGAGTNDPQPEWEVLQATGFLADPEVDGTRQHNFCIIHFGRKKILIGGTAYTGEIKKGVFTVLNYLLPDRQGVPGMHCSANTGMKGDTAIFFGLSGTGKTTLSADPRRRLIGDDEHGWSDTGIFNFEGGCYAKCIDLSAEKEPDIFNAIKEGALLENVVFRKGTRQIDYTDKSITENTRASYPLHHIKNIARPSVGGHPSNIFFLTCDAYGVLPPVAKLDAEQAMYHFISGYTARIAGTEAGIKEPRATFSACFGGPFIPLHPVRLAALLGERIEAHRVKVWLINTGWIGGSYGTGERIPLAYTRAILDAVLNGDLDEVAYRTMPVFSLQIPCCCKNVPDAILDPQNSWKDGAAWLMAAQELERQFRKNMEKIMQTGL